MSIKKFPFIISSINFDEDIKPLIKEIRPYWDVGKLKSMKMQGGISNLLFGVYSNDEFKYGETDMVLVRIYGESLLDRDAEMRNMSMLSSFDLAAKVWGQFFNGCCYQFIHGTVMDEDSVRDPKIYELIINEIVKLHTVQIDLNIPKKPFLFPKLRAMVSQLPATFENRKKNEKYINEFPNREQLNKNIDELENVLLKLNCPVTFCHNDLLIKNLVINSKGDRVHMIDFEYAEFNYCAFDIGDHFVEFAGVDTVDYSRYPDKSFQMKWLRQYLETLNSFKANKGDVTCPVDTDEVEHWYTMVNKFSLVTHIFWSVWSIFQERNSLIDFDYLGYAVIRWNEYLYRKDEFLAL